MIKLSNSTYNKAKWLVTIVLPAAATLYFTLGTVWGWNNIQQVIGSISAATVFLGVILGISSNAYYKAEDNFDGTINVTKEDDVTVYTLELDSNPDTLAGKSSITFRVNRS